MSTTPTIRLGTDIAIPRDPAGVILPGPTGDLPLVTGVDALRADIERGLLTEPGAMVYRPTFGAGAAGRLGTPNSPTERGRFAASVRRTLLQDPRLKDATVTVLALDGASDGVTVRADVLTRDESRVPVEVAL